MAEEIKRLESLRAAQEMEAARNAQAAQAAQAALAEQIAKAEQAEKAAKAAQAAAEAQAAKAAKAEKEAQAAKAAQAAQVAKAERAAAAEAARAEKAAAAEAARAEKAAKSEKNAAAEAERAQRAAAAEAERAQKAAAAEAAKAEKAVQKAEKAPAKKPPIGLIAGIAGGVVAIAVAVILIIVLNGNNSGTTPDNPSQSASETTAANPAAPVIPDSGEYAGRPVYSSLDDFNASDETDPVFVLGHKVLKKENFVITRNDGTVDLNGNIVDTTVYVRNDDPNKTVTIRNGMINSDIDGSRESSADFKGNIVLEDISLGGDVWSDGHNITFVSGNYKTINNVTNIDSPGTRTITINGGSFTELAAGSNGEEYVINGGSFKTKPNSSWIASGCAISDTADNSGYYTVGDAAAVAPAPVESAPLSFRELVSQGGTIESTYETDLTETPLKFIIPAIFTDDGTEDYFHNFVYEYEPAGQHIILGIFLEKNDYYRGFNSDTIIEANSGIEEENMTVWRYDDNTAYIELQDETGLQMTIMGCREDLMVTVLAYVSKPTLETSSAVIEDDILYVYDIIYDSLWMNLSSDAGDQSSEWYNEDPYSDSDTQFTNYLSTTEWNNHDMTTSHGRSVGYDMPCEFKTGDSANSVCIYTYSDDSSGQDMTIRLEIDNSDEMNNIKPEAISKFVSEADIHGVTDVKMNEVVMINDNIAYGFDRTLDGIQSGDYVVMYFAGVKGDMFIGLTVRMCKEGPAAKRFMDIQDITSLYMDIYNSVAVG